MTSAHAFKEQGDCICGSDGGFVGYNRDDSRIYRYQYFVFSGTCSLFRRYLVAEAMENKKRDESGKYSLATAWVVKAIVFNAGVALLIIVNYYFFGFDMYEGNRLYGILSSNLAVGIVILIVILEAFMVIFDKAYIYFMRAVDYRFSNTSIY